MGEQHTSKNDFIKAVEKNYRMHECLIIRITTDCILQIVTILNSIRKHTIKIERFKILPFLSGRNLYFRSSFM